MAAELLPLKAGDRITVLYQGRRLAGAVILASPNFKSLMVRCEAIVYGFVGMVPLVWIEGIGYQTLNGGDVELVLKEIER